jgi:hypothetical protein
MSAESLSSQGSGRGGFMDGSIGAFASSPYDSLSSSHDSPRRRNPTSDNYNADQYQQHVASQHVEKSHTQSAHGTPMARNRVRRNSEPDYANLPAVQQLLSELGVVGNYASNCSAPFDLDGDGYAAVDDLRSDNIQRSLDSMSPVEFARQPNKKAESVHSVSTHESTSEGWNLCLRSFRLKTVLSSC